ncbi:hypothetical protein BCR12_12685 [Limnothrix sp. P13C2]|nr:hypothetical protein BCR12_12685 [Limnothrix sp. P13C2]
MKIPYQTALKVHLNASKMRLETKFCAIQNSAKQEFLTEFLENRQDTADSRLSNSLARPQGRIRTATRQQPAPIGKITQP